jgi:ArsR family transcriptional regulator
MEGAMDGVSAITHEKQAEVFKAVGHPIRLQIVKVLVHGEMAVTDIVRAVGAEQSNVSRHLSLLKQAGVLSSHKAGLKVFYSLRSAEFRVNLQCVIDCISGGVEHGVAAHRRPHLAAPSPEAPAPPGADGK